MVRKPRQSRGIGGTCSWETPALACGFSPPWSAWGTADIDDKIVGIEPLVEERHIDHEGRAMEALGGAEDSAGEAVGDHDVVADFDGEQGTPLTGRQ